jgi:D-alanyl-D-alanine carboxypeptidase (penicillin-binding protein 5/6)
MKKITYLLSLVSCLCVGNAFAFSTNAKSAFLVDYDSGAVLFEKDADTLMPPSSMIKLMTLALVFDAVKSGDLKMTDMLTVGPNADYKDPRWYPASKICLVAGQTISVNDIIMGLIVQSGGDAAVVAAETLGGTESEFATMMQKKARAIGMPESTFGNASGLNDPNNLMTVRELARLGTYMISEYPEMYPLFATRRFEYSNYQSDWCRDWGRTHTLNYNKLLFNMPGADGMKTGHTDQGGYGMVASSRVGGRRLVGVINGLNAKNHDALAAEMKKMLNHGYASTSNKVFYQPGDTIVEIPVWYGRQKTVAATVTRPFAATLQSNQSLRDVRVVARYDEPLPAPIAAGDTVGEVIAYLRGDVIARAPLVAQVRVNKVQFLARVWKNLSVIFNGR